MRPTLFRNRLLGATLTLTAAGPVGLASAREYFDLFATPKMRSMGRAMTAIADDYNSLYTNPAGLANAENWELRAPDLFHVGASSGIMNLVNALKDVKSTISTSAPFAALRAFDGQGASVNLDVLRLSWMRNRMAIALDTFSLNVSFRVRTPTALFAKVDTRMVADTGLSLGYAQPFYDNRLRVGVTFRPFLFRAGADLTGEKALQASTIASGGNLSTILDQNKNNAGAGLGIDADIGVQGNLDPLDLNGIEFKPMAGIVMQNVLATKFGIKAGFSDFQGSPPPLERKINIGVAGSIENLGVFKPTLSFEIRNLLITTDDVIERIAIGFEAALKPKSWFQTFFRGHFYAGNLGGGIAGKLWIGEMELGTDAVNLGRGPGIGVDRRYYLQLSSVW